MSTVLLEYELYFIITLPQRFVAICKGQNCATANTLH